MITRIQLSSIPVVALCGCLPAERELPITLMATVRVRTELHFGEDPVYDRIDHTLDYRLILETMRTVAASRHFALVESLAETSAAHIRRLHPAILSVEVELSKPGVLPDGVLPTITALCEG
ncbi:dihydroneopterin aldolase [Myxococcota bacterium]|nr:dihydroneopterin aldolase [Myxococcota bacterium]MBU1412965.1 dihydroneopterin aldolase [Myxococcota bacterium]MBU1511328.1 dihydroneopterin aldolase [Myxococcota bacterium]